MSEAKGTVGGLPMTGRRLRHYEILEKLGEGGMGLVYKAHDTHLDRFVAIKILPPDKLTDPDRCQRFTQEAKAASALSNPHIVTVYDVASDGEVAFIAMEYVAGRTLDAVIPRKGMRLNEALKIAVQVADALAAAHTAGIVHRDVKPSNIMVQSQGGVKVLDFGLVKRVRDAECGDSDSTTGAAVKTDAGRIVGTVSYMSPEQAQGRTVDQRSDIFSFGSLLYEMVSGKRPFEGESSVMTLAAIVEKDPLPLPGEIPAELDTILWRCLRKDPARRYQHMADVQVELQDLIEASDSGTTRTAVAAPAPRRPALAFAVLLLALILATAGWFWMGRRVSPPSPLRIVNLTSYPGSESEPALSPDGTRVAFVWNGEKEDNSDVYVQMVGDAQAQRRTTAPERDLYPCWSPDGRQLAFMRLSADGKTGTLFTTSAVAGPEQKLYEWPNPGRGLSWTPDGAFIFVSRDRAANTSADDGAGLYRVPVAGGPPVRLTNPAAPATDTWPHVSWDGRTVAFARNAYPTVSSDLFLQPLTSDGRADGRPRQLTTTGMPISGLAWHRDGQSIVFGGQPAFELFYLYRVFIDGHAPPRRLELGGHYEYRPSTCPGSDRLAFGHADASIDIYRLHVGGHSEPLFRSSFASYSPQFSPDGRKVAFTSNRNEQSTEIWVANADGTDSVQLTHGPGHNQGSASWSRDGKWVAFDSQAANGQFDIYVIESSGGQARRITFEPSNENTPAWSFNGQWIYFRSDRTGRGEIWRTGFSGGPAKQVTTDGAEMAYESDDGKALLNNTRSGEVWARPVEGGLPQRLVSGVSVLSNSVAVSKDGFFYMGLAGADRLFPLLFYNLASGKSREVARLDMYQPRISATPDGRDVLYAAYAPGTRVDLKLIENFR